MLVNVKLEAKGYKKDYISRLHTSLDLLNFISGAETNLAVLALLFVKNSIQVSMPVVTRI